MDKQIEEMSSYLIGKNVTGSDSTKVLSLGYLTVKEIAYILVNAGYRKIPEGAVLTREELDDMFTFKTTRGGFYNILDTVRKVERKETAEKFKALLEGTVPQGLLDEIAKEITEGE